MGVFLVDQLRVGNVVVVERLEHILVDKARNRVVGRDNDIIARGLDARIQVFVGIEGVVDNLDAGFLLELVDEVGVDVLAPVIHVEHLRRGCIAAAGEKSGAHRAAQQQGKHAFFHGCIAPFRRAASRRFSSRDWRILMTISSTSTIKNRMVEMALIFGVMRWRVME